MNVEVAESWADQHGTQWKVCLKTHIDSAHGDMQYTCDKCDYKTTWKGNLKYHMDSVHGDVWYTCDQCDFKARWKQSHIVSKDI